MIPRTISTGIATASQPTPSMTVTADDQGDHGHDGREGQQQESKN